MQTNYAIVKEAECPLQLDSHFTLQSVAAFPLAQPRTQIPHNKHTSRSGSFPTARQSLGSQLFFEYTPVFWFFFIIHIYLEKAEQTLRAVPEQLSHGGLGEPAS
jgi:hypothetical protein